MRVQLQQAYCLHARRYRESSRIVEMLTPEHGLVSCLGHSSKKKNSSVDLLFTPLLISWSGRGELFTLTHVESISAKQFTTSEVSIMGMYLNELILKLVPKSSPSKEIFDLYGNVIELLEKGDNQEKILRLFEIELLELVGHGLSLDKEVDHETPIHEDSFYRYDVGLGPARIQHENTAWNVIKGATLIGLQSPLSMDASCLSEAKRLMRGIINWHLDSRPLHSREILQFMQA
ncbi:MAG: DNA repair protein RecO [Gammaproteobacteria bacterium]|nr:DNA repair protein RecO [Gammaproteobacteria bacterium]